MPLSKTKRRVIQHFLKERQISQNEWKCCENQFDSLSNVGRHVNKEHAAEIQQREQEELDRQKVLEEYENNLNNLKQRRGEKVRNQ